MTDMTPNSLLWITWKDHKHPEAGGAEVVARELTTRLAAAGTKVTILTCGYEGASATETIDGINFIRVGSSRYLHPAQAGAYFRKHLRDTHEVVIEEVQGCAPYFATFSRPKAGQTSGAASRYFYFYHQLARLNWLYEVPKPFSYVGYYGLAPLATRAASWSGAPVITVSDSTRQVLAGYGFKPEKTHIISEGLHFDPLPSLEGVKKYDKPTMLSFGAMRAMKRTLDQIRTFELAKRELPDLQLKVAGSNKGAYGAKVMAAIEASPYKADIEYLGKVDDATKAELMQKCHVIVVTSVEEGWGLIVSEANGQGTPAAVYNVSGLRDSVRDGKTGVVTKPEPAALAAGVVALLQDKPGYEAMRQAAWQWSKQLTFEQALQDFVKITGLRV